jgi:hypothetical protein
MSANNRPTLDEVRRMAREFIAQGDALSIHPGHGNSVASCLRTLLAALPVVEAAKFAIGAFSKDGEYLRADVVDHVEAALAAFEKVVERG